MAPDISLRTMPAITSVSPGRRFTSVLELCLRRPGTPMTVTSSSMDETSVCRLAEMTPWALITGSTSKRTPYSLKSTLAAPLALSTGMGSSPPATKRALPPERVERRGSASTAASPFCTIRSIMLLSEETIDALVAKG